MGYRSGAKQVERLYERKRRLDAILKKYDISKEDRVAIDDIVLINDKPDVQVYEFNVKPYWSTALMAIVGTIGLIAAATKFAPKIWEQLMLLLSSAVFQAAYAATAGDPPVKADLSWLVPWVVLMILVVMAIAFLASMVVLLTTKDVPENQAKLKAATDIVKTFGGFFSGIATTALSGALT